MNRRDFLKATIAAGTPTLAAAMGSNAAQAAGQPEIYTAVWSAAVGTGAQYWDKPSDIQTATNFIKQQVQKGLRLVAWCVFHDHVVVNGKNTYPERYVSCWGAHGKGSGPIQILPGQKWSDFRESNQGYFKQGLRLVSVSPYNRGGEDGCAAAWSGGLGTGDQVVLKFTSWDEFNNHDENFFNDGYRLAARGFHYNSVGQPTHTGVWRKGLGNGAQFSNPEGDWNTFASFADGQHNAGRRCVSIATAIHSNQQKFVGTWGAHGWGSGEERKDTIWGLENFKNADEQNFKDGLRLVALNVTRDISASI
jgi:Polyglycine hydrolase-like, structural repeat